MAISAAFGDRIGANPPLVYPIPPFFRRLSTAWREFFVEFALKRGLKADKRRAETAQVTPVTDENFRYGASRRSNSCNGFVMEQ
ncbi:MAG TPA: hypothetical protein VLS27_13565 [Gammaproteobacteria bacterium]|nr:hypothetical protein [Gammaproteobacteria bacterium]